MIEKKYKVKLGLVFFLYIGMLSFLGYRLFSIQYLQYDHLNKKARDIHEIKIKLEPKRGAICDRNGNLLAVSVLVPSVYADPSEIQDPEAAAKALAPVLGLEKNFIKERLAKEKYFVWLKRKVTKEVKEKVQSLQITGIGFIEEPKRFYPKGKLAAHVLGFVNIDSEGQEGIENILDEYLAGKPGLRITEKDAVGREVLGWRNKEIPPVDGYKVVLTIDEVIQYEVEEELDKAVKQFNPKAAMAVVVDPDTCEILALASRPNYDPNDYTKSTPDSRRNRAVTDCFEPGSVFKMFVAAAAINENLYDLKDTIFCENGVYQVPGGVLHDHVAHGTLTFQQVIEKSSNIGMAKVGQKLGKETLYEYLDKFGFGQKTGVLLSGEISGTLWKTSKWSKMSITRIPMGHEVSVTAIQLARAVGVIANGGKIMKPLIVKRIMDNEGRTIKEFKPEVIEEVVASESIDQLKIALKGVVSAEGTALKAKLKDFSVAGKTGTAQKINPDGTYSHSDFMSSFIGFTPAEKPELLIVSIFDSPKPVYYGGVVAAPVFRNIAEKVLAYLNIEPELKAPNALVAKN